MAPNCTIGIARDPLASLRHIRRSPVTFLAASLDRMSLVFALTIALLIQPSIIRHARSFIDVTEGSSRPLVPVEMGENFDYISVSAPFSPGEPLACSLLETPLVRPGVKGPEPHKLRGVP